MIYLDDFRVYVEDVPTISGITLARSAGGVKISTDTELIAAKLIFATYDLKGKMIDRDIVDVNMNAQKEETFAPKS